MPKSLLKITVRRGCSSVNLRIFLEHIFLRTPREGCFFKFVKKGKPNLKRGN